MLGDTKIKKAIIATIFTILLAIACYLTVYAVQVLFSHQQITQPVTDAACFQTLEPTTLPEGYTNFSGTCTIPYALNVTTKNQTGLYLKITSPNATELVNNYTRLVLHLRNHNEVSDLALLDLILNSPYIYYTLSPNKSYSFDYYFEYTPKITGTNQFYLTVEIVG